MHTHIHVDTLSIQKAQEFFFFQFSVIVVADGVLLC